MNKLISFESASFIENLLEPVAKIQDSFTLHLTENQCKVVCQKDQTKLRIVGPIEYPYKEELLLNFKNVKSLIRVIKFLNSDKITFYCDKDCVIFLKDDGTRINHHVADSLLITPVKFDENVLSSLVYDCAFTLNKDIIKKIISAGSLSDTETKKVYFSTKGGKVFCDIDDKTENKVDIIHFPITDSFTGNLQTPQSISFDIIKFLSNNTVEVGVVYKKCFNFAIETETKYKINLIQMSYVK